jgi:L-amino acid N-acyltransferase YncA
LLAASSQASMNHGREEQGVFEISMYPRKVSLRDGTNLTLRPMRQEDENPLLSFFLEIPPEERWFLKEDVTSPRVIKEWASDIDYKRALPILAFTDDGRIVADAALVRRRGGSRSHVGEVRVVVGAEFRHRGLGVLLLRELCDIANDAGIERVIAEMASESQKDAIQACEWLGFYKIATLEGMIKDPNGHEEDLVLMTMPLGRYYEWSKF